MPVSAPKSDVVTRTLRRQIVEGRFPPGERMPTWSQMQKQFGVTRPTLTRAMERLKSDGLIYSDSTRGTFVMPRPPHLHRYAVVFGITPDQPDFNRFWATIAREAERLNAADPDRDLVNIFGVTGHADNEAYRSLRRLVRTGLLAGLIIVGTLDEKLMQMPELFDGRVPCTVILGGAFPYVPTVAVDHASFIDQSLDAVADAGRSRVAVLSNDNDNFPGYAKAIADRGLTAEPYWFLEASARTPRAARNIVQLLIDRPAHERPEALIVTDDNLVENALAGVIASRVRVPDDLFVITHCNWPSPVDSVVPVTRLGFDVRAVLAECLDCLDQQRDGKACEKLVRVPATFEPD